MIATRRRQAEALKLREQGKPYSEIGRMLKIAAPTAFRHVLQAINDIVPVETARNTLTIELGRLDALLGKYYPLALDGDQGAAKLVLKIEHQRARLCGLYPQERGSGVAININNSDAPDDARKLGIQVKLIDFQAERPAEIVPKDLDLQPLRMIEPPAGPPPHNYSSTARNPATVPPSAPRNSVVSQEPFPSPAKDSALFSRQRSWMS